MLKFINQKGPLIEGIFRKSASIKLCRALKEELNSGDKVNLEDESVPVVASVIKDFLRNIQESIFSASLYDKWLGVLDQGNEEEKITASQRLLDQLPRVNTVLLQYLFGVLHNTEQHSSSNQMTAYNLSLCIAPSLFCPPNANSSELEKDLKTIAFVQFFLENCLQLWGEVSCDYLVSLLGESSIISDEGTSELQSFPGAAAIQGVQSPAGKQDAAPGAGLALSVSELSLSLDKTLLSTELGDTVS
nr:rho GTPase-activating protein 20-like [Vicugna pacos]